MAETKKKILIVEDDGDTMKTMNDSLQLKGYDTVLAMNGMQGVRMAKTAKPDLIILDIMMPFKDGYSVSKELKTDEATKDIPIIVVTAKDLSKDMGDALNMMADWYVIKPYDPEALLKKIESSLSKKKK